VVHDPSQALASSRKTWIALAVAALIAAGAASGCGGGTSTQPQVDVGPNVGQPINLADCHDWNQANTEQRLGTIKQLKDFAGGPVVGNSATAPSGRGAVLDDQQAYDLFNNYCKSDFARGFKLYKLYERAAAFTGHQQ
jgi:hypothetical protein